MNRVEIELEELKRVCVDNSTRMAVAESNIDNIKGDIREIKDGMREIDNNTRNSFRLNITSSVMLVIAIVGWIISNAS